MTIHRFSLPIAALALALLAVSGLGATACSPATDATSVPAEAASASSQHATSRATAAPAKPSVLHPEIGFRARNALAEHFAKHGSEFKVATQADYLVLAQALRDAPAGGDVVEERRADGVICRFDRATGAFLAFNEDLTIRTFFRPNDGEAYFTRQLEREH